MFSLLAAGVDLDTKKVPEQKVPFWNIALHTVYLLTPTGLDE